jgi:hypothetical protein
MNLRRLSTTSNGSSPPQRISLYTTGVDPIRGLASHCPRLITSKTVVPHLARVDIHYTGTAKPLIEKETLLESARR